MAVVIISKGHRATKHGNTGAIGINGLSEYGLVGGVGDAAMEALAQLDIPAVTAPRERIPGRFKYVAEVMAKYATHRVAFIDIHANAFSNPKARGTETFVSSERSKSLTLGALVHACLVEGYRNLDSSWVDRGIKYEGMFLIFSKTMAVVNGVKAADFSTRYFSTLVELGFVTNPADAGVIASPAGVLAAGRAIAGGIQEWLAIER
jgi:N-acetylmuramoyl-L-alanine amidase